MIPRREFEPEFDKQEPPVGVEPTTTRLRIESSTTELRWRSRTRMDTEISGWARIGVSQRRIRVNPPFSAEIRDLSALARIRTGTALATAPSRQRVYQFHHQGVGSPNFLRGRNISGLAARVKKGAATPSTASTHQPLSKTSGILPARFCLIEMLSDPNQIGLNRHPAIHHKFLALNVR